MKRVIYLLWINCLLWSCTSTDQEKDRKELEKATAAIRDAFKRGDVDAIVTMHHPDIVKYFGGSNVVKGRDQLRKALRDMVNTAHMEFIDHKLESLIFNGNTAIETSLFTIKSTPLNGDTPSIGRGRAMVVYVRDKTSPTGWLSVREMTQAAPDEYK